MARNIQSFALRDFAGGLNLRADQFQLGVNESPDMLNVDVDPRGGVRLRRGVSTWGVPAGNPIHTLVPFYEDGGTGDQVLIGRSTAIEWSNGGAWTQIAGGNTVSDPSTAAQFKGSIYLQNGTDKPIKWTGTTASRLDQAWSENIEAPTTGNMPIGKVVCAHNGHIFVANTLEDFGLRQRSRIRFSHINQPESFRSTDWFDVDPGVDGDEIVAMVPFTDHLVVFKRKSIYAVFGFDAESFQVQMLSRDLGVANLNAVTTTPAGVFFFSWPAGLMQYDGRGMKWVFEPLVPAIDSGDIPSSRLGEVTLGWLRNRVWLSVPWLGGDKTTFVYDPSLSKDGAWVRYGLSLGPMAQWLPEETSNRLALAAHESTVLSVEQHNQPYDEFVDGVQTHIESYWTCAWVDAGETAIRKRWRRPWLVLQGVTNDFVEVAVFHDYNAASRSKTFYERVNSQDEGFIWDDPLAEWDDGIVWAASGDMHEIERGSTLGLSHAVQLRFRGPESNNHWGLDNITFVYVPRKLR